MGDFDALALFARNDLIRTGLHDAAERPGPARSIERAAGPGVAFERRVGL